jgi:hypothetical protein
MTEDSIHLCEACPCIKQESYNFVANIERDGFQVEKLWVQKNTWLIEYCSIYTPCLVMARTHVAEEHVTSTVTCRNRRDASGVLCGSAMRLYDSNDQVQFSWVQRSEVGWLVSSRRTAAVRSLWAAAAVSSWGPGIVQEPGVRGMTTAESCYQAMTGEGIADLKDLVHAVVNWAVWISDSTIVACSYHQKVFNKSNQSKPRLWPLIRVKILWSVDVHTYSK